MMQRLIPFFLSIVLFSCNSEQDVEPGSDAMFIKIFGGGNLDDPQKMLLTADGGYLILSTTEFITADGNFFKVKLIQTDRFGDQVWQRVYPEDNALQYKGRSLIQLENGYMVVGDRIQTQGDDDDVVQVSSSLLLLEVDLMGNEVSNSNVVLSLGDLTGQELLLTSTNEIVVLANMNSDTTDNNIYVSRFDRTSGTFLEDCTAQYEANDVNLVKSIFEMGDGSLAFSGNIANETNGQIFVLPDCQASALSGPNLVSGTTASFALNQMTETFNGFGIVGTTNQNGNPDIFIATLTSQGEVNTLSVLERATEQQGLTISSSNDGGGFIVGGLTLENTGNEADLFLQKVSVNGTVEWTQIYGDLIEEEARFILPTPDGGYAILGCIEFGGIENIVLLKTDSEGNIN
ncbi:MAG: hypothetical protein AAGF85_20730 [Bacteroidota bacterium]